MSEEHRTFDELPDLSVRLLNTAACSGVYISSLGETDLSNNWSKDRFNYEDTEAFFERFAAACRYAQSNFCFGVKDWGTRSGYSIWDMSMASAMTNQWQNNARSILTKLGFTPTEEMTSEKNSLAVVRFWTIPISRLKSRFEELGYDPMRCLDVE